MSVKLVLAATFIKQPALKGQYFAMIPNVYYNSKSIYIN